MVNICYLVPIACLLNAMSHGLLISKRPNYSNQLSPENGNGFGRSQYTFIRPKLSKREADFEKSSRTNSDLVSEIKDANYDENNVSYFSQIADNINVYSTEKIVPPVKDTVWDWNNGDYVTAERISAKLADSQKLKKAIDHYVAMGKEKWAGFLATSSSTHFQRIIGKLKKIIGKRENDLEGDEDKEDFYDSETDMKRKNATEESKDENVNGNENEKTIENVDQFSYKLKYFKNETREHASKQSPLTIISKNDLVKLRSMFSDVSKFWGSKDAKDIIKSANYVTYEDFKVEGEDEVFGSDLPPKKDSQDHEEEIWETLKPDEIKTDEQKLWLKSNALRRVSLIQKLFDEELSDEDIYEIDQVHFTDSNVFVNADDSEFENMSPGFRMQSTNLALYIAFMATEVAFIIGF